MKTIMATFLFFVFMYLVTAIAARAANENYFMVYGLGTETCQVALSHDWMNNGELAWVAGFMSSTAFGADKHEMLPGQDTKTLVTIVYNQCQAKPFDTLATATGEIAARLLNVQKPVLSKTPKGAEKF